MARTGGGVIHTTIRSGANSVHGSAFGFLRETDWLANNFFANQAGQPIPAQPFKNYGDSRSRLTHHRLGQSGGLHRNAGLCVRQRQSENQRILAVVCSTSIFRSSKRSR
jgi:hypothetical protein